MDGRRNQVVLLVIATPEGWGLDVGIAQLRRGRGIENRVGGNVCQGVVGLVGK